MAQKQQRTVVCQICNKKWKISEARSAGLVRESIVEVIRKTYQDWSPDGYICIPDLNKFRDEYVKDIISSGRGEVSVLENRF
jgi:hypothetical protein